LLPQSTVAAGTVQVDGTAVLGNVWAATRHINTYVCPSNPFVAPTTRDPAGFGGTDYFATVYTDISPTLGCRDKATRADGALTVDTSGLTASTTSGTTTISADSAIPTSVAISAITDGTSNTIAVIEDAGRVSPQAYSNGLAPYYTLSTYTDNMLGGASTLPDDVTGDTSGALTGTSAKGVWRWADADACGSGISGPFGNTSTTAYTGKVINQNSYPIGGYTSSGSLSYASPSGSGVKGAAGTGCNWTQNNCGANDEAFSFHTAGCNTVMVDGSVRFLSDSLDPVTMRRLVTRSEGIPVDNDTKVFN